MKRQKIKGKEKFYTIRVSKSTRKLLNILTESLDFKNVDQTVRFLYERYSNEALDARLDYTQ
jgi:hypothetical protein